MNTPYHTPLSAEQQRACGLPTPAPLAMADQVRFSELDVLYHVNNVAYMIWLERLRIRYTQMWGISDYDPARTNPRVVIRSGEIHYREELRMDADYIVTCGCTGYRNTSFSLAQQIWSEGRLRVTFDCVLVLLQPDANERMPLPEHLVDRFRTIDQARSALPEATT